MSKWIFEDTDKKDVIDRFTEAEIKDTINGITEDTNRTIRIAKSIGMVEPSDIVSIMSSCFTLMLLYNWCKELNIEYDNSFEWLSEKIIQLSTKYNPYNKEQLSKLYESIDMLTHEKLHKD